MVIVSSPWLIAKEFPEPAKAPPDAPHCWSPQPMAAPVVISVSRFHPVLISADSVVSPRDEVAHSPGLLNQVPGGLALGHHRDIVALMLLFLLLGDVTISGEGFSLAAFWECRVTYINIGNHSIYAVRTRLFS